MNEEGTEIGADRRNIRLDRDGSVLIVTIRSGETREGAARFAAGPAGTAHRPPSARPARRCGPRWLAFGRPV